VEIIDLTDEPIIQKEEQKNVASLLKEIDDFPVRRLRNASNMKTI